MFGLLLATALSGCTQPIPVGDAKDSADDDSGEAAPNEAPVARDDDSEVFAGGTVEIDLTANDSDPEDDNLKIVDVSRPEHGNVNIVASGDVEYEADDDFDGLDSFTYIIEDEAGNTAEALVEIEVLPLPWLTIVDPLDDATIVGDTVQITFEVDGCDFEQPDGDELACHLHKFVDGVAWNDPDGNAFGQYTVAPFDIWPLDPGSHEITLKLALNDGSDGLWSPEISDTVSFEVVAE